jgi:hypothetical protein
MRPQAAKIIERFLDAVFRFAEERQSRLRRLGYSNDLSVKGSDNVWRTWR